MPPNAFFAGFTFTWVLAGVDCLEIDDSGFLFAGFTSA
jgi:hypothetical protein